MEITIKYYELTNIDFFYSCYVCGNYFEDTIDSSMALFDEIKRQVNSKYYDIDSIVNDLLLSDYYRFMY